MITLKGIAWNHTRGFISVAATAQRYEELNPGVSIIWEKRSLQAFADAPLKVLAENFDLIIMDHPHAAIAAREKVLLPLNEYLSADFLEDLAANSVGGSHQSYNIDGQQWTLATDAATPIATWRPDLIEQYGIELPCTWEDVLRLAEQGYVSPSLFPIDVLMNTYMFCQAHGEAPFTSQAHLVQPEILKAALTSLRELATRCAPECLARDPIRTAEYMSRTYDKAAAYCPFAYGYSNYSRAHYADHLLKAGGLVSFNGKALRSTLGGAGIAVSAKSQHREIAVDYARFTGSAVVQKGIYTQAGGQPGHRAAWLDGAINADSHDFFKDTLDTLDNAFLRPRYAGYMSFQDAATPVAHGAIAGKINIDRAAEQLNELYLRSLTQ